MFNTLLTDLFLHLRSQSEAPLGIGEYLAFVRAVEQEGQWVDDVEQLSELAQVLWFKNADKEKQAQFKKIIALQYEEQLLRITRQLLPKKETDTSSIQQPDSKAKAESDSSSSPEVKKTEPKQPEEEETEQNTNPLIPEPEKKSIEVFLSKNAEAANIDAEHESEDPISPMRHRFVFTEDYLPLNQRQMEQIWRLLFQADAQGLQRYEQLDLQATIRKMAQGHRFWHEPVFTREKNATAELILLIDHLGSMAPFEAHIRQLCTTLKENTRRKVSIYWFRNCPDLVLFTNANHTEAETKDQFKRKLSARKNSKILIFSDAGAAKGRFNEERLDATLDFLKDIRLARKIAWLNPMPTNRRHNTTAEYIAFHVPMFSFDRHGFLQAVNHLRTG